MLQTITRREISQEFSGNAATEVIDILDLVDGPGEHYFVDSVNGLDTNPGTTWNSPLATLDAAVGKCSPNRGDVIYLRPGHAETLSADSAVDIDVAGVTVVGLGQGASRPTFTFDTGVAADFKLAAASTRIINLLFLGGIDALTGPIEVTGTDCAILNCEYRDVTGQATDVIVTVDGADRLVIDGLRFIGAAAAGGASAIALIGADDCIIKNCEIYGNFSVGAIDCRTTASNRLRVHDCTIWTENAADICIVDTITASTGIIGPNIFMMLQDNTTNITEAITGATFVVMDVGVHVCNLVNEKSMAINWVASLDAI